MARRRAKVVGFTSQVGRRVKKNAGATLAGIVNVDTRPRKLGSTSLFRFTLNASLSTGTADADILEMDGTDTGTDADVLDPLGIFSSLTTGYPGLCIMQAGIYYVIQAPCPG